MKKVFVSILIIGMGMCFHNLCAQISQGGLPPSFKQADKSALSTIEYIKMPYVDVEALRAEDVYNDRIKDQPWRFGQDMYVNYNPGNSGTWDVLEDGGRIWRLGIISKGALSINLTFNRYKLPKGAKLFVYTPDKSQVIGAFTSYNNQDDGYFATTLVEDESVIIEYYEPHEVDFPGELNLWRVVHGYRGFDKFLKSFGQSGYCNVNAVCPQGDPYRKQIRSAALLILGPYACSGALINNTNNDGTPLLLTAAHCYKAGINDAATAVFRFNWQSATCSNPATSPPYNSMSGAVERARFTTSDFWLMELNQTPPEEYNVYYSGWNRTTASRINGTVFGIHHPSGDIKKISWSTGGVDASAGGGDPGTGDDHWRVAVWSDGTTTEPGSSGSPLYDPNGRIIGQLHGGPAACGNTLPDWYGNLGYSWTGGGTSSLRLSNWLDPSSTGVITLNGYDPVTQQPAIDAGISEISEPGYIYNDTVEITPGITIRNSGTDNLTSATVGYIVDSEDPVEVNWTGNLALNETEEVAFPAIKLEFGEHSIVAEISVTDDENPENDNLVKYFTVFNCDSISLPVEEGFNLEEVPGCWTIQYVSGDIPEISFVSAGVIPECTPSEGTYMVKFNSYECIQGSQIRLTSPKFSTVNCIDLRIAFDWFYDSEFTDREDRMIIQYSTDSLTWYPVDSVLRCTELANGWERKTMDLPEETKDRNSLYIGLLFHSEFGKNCYLDNLVIHGIDTTKPYIDFYATPQVTEIDSLITFSDSSRYGTFSTWEWDFGEGAVPATATGQGPHDVYFTTGGYKTISLLVDGAYERVKEDYIKILSDMIAPKGLTADIVNVKNVHLRWNQDAFNDDFESGDLSLWHKTIKGNGIAGEMNGKAYWHVQGDSTQYIYEGNYATLANWGYNINTWIITNQIMITDQTVLSFIWQSSYHWHVYPNNNGDLFVKISFDGGLSWEEPVWTFGKIGEWENWTWYETTIDLSEYADSILTIAFNIVADDNADIAMDYVSISSKDKAYKIGTFPVSEPICSDNHSKTLKNVSSQTIPFMNSIKSIFLDYSVFRDDLEIDQTTETNYMDVSVSLGVHTYYVVANYDDPPGVSDPSNVVQVEIIETGIIKPGKFEDIRLFPNPSTGELNLKLDREYILTILTMQGSVLDELVVSEHTERIDLSEHPKGVYVLRFKDKDSIYTRKVILL